MKTPFQSHNDAHSRPQARAPVGARLAGGSAGLVSLKTSDTPDLSEVPIDQVQARITRLRRSVTVGARLIQDSVGWLGFKPAMLTLTYRDIDGFKPLHISVLIKHIRQWLARRGHVLRYVWVAELQMRGALHYHVVTWLPRGLTLPKPDKQGWWPHGHTRIEWARHAVGYLCKYVSKFDGQTSLPKGVRLHGAGGFDELATKIRRWFNLPSWLKSLAGIDCKFVRVKGVGLVESGTGICVQSPWRVSFSGGRVVATRLFTYSSSLHHVGGPYSLLRSER